MCSARKLCLSIMSIVCIIVSAFNASFYVLMQYMTIVGFRSTTSANRSRHSAPPIMDTLRITTPILQPPNKFILPHQKKCVSLQSLTSEWQAVNKKGIAAAHPLMPFLMGKRRSVGGAEHKRIDSMNAKRLLVLTMMALCAATAWAYDFSAVAPSGQTLYYNTIADGHVGVVRPGTTTMYNNYVTGNLIIPDHVTHNGITYEVNALTRVNYTGTFEGCSELTSVIIPNTVTLIDGDAFFLCSGLTSVEIPNSVTHIGANAFGSTGLINVIIPNSVTNIGSGAFSGCGDLSSVYIPNTVTSIGDYAFYYVRHIQYHGTATGSPWGAIYMNGVIDGDYAYTDSSKTTLAAYVGTGIDATIPSTVINIRDKAFQGCGRLKHVHIPTTVTNIGASAFSGCTDITSLNIPSSVTTIGTNAFYWLRHIEYHGSLIGGPWGAFSMNGVTDGDFVFMDSTETTLIAYVGEGGAVSIPSTVTTIGSHAFFYCRSLTSITIPNSVTIIGEESFFNCTGLTSVDLPNTITTICDGAFCSCEGLTTFTIPNSVITIGKNAFDACNLSSVTIGSSVTSIDTAAFYSCSKLSSVFCKAIQPPTLGYACFSANNTMQFYVPCGSVATYQINANWQNFATRIHGTPFLDFTYDFISSNDTFGTVNYGIVDCNSNIVVTAIPNERFRLIGWSDGGIGEVRTIHLVSDTSIVAIFDSIVFAVVGQPNNTEFGYVLGSDTVYYGDTVTLLATANYGYHFNNWGDGDTNNPRMVVTTQDQSFTAYFDYNSYTITLNVDTNIHGSVIGGGTYNYLSEQTIIAIASYGYHFTAWNDGYTNYLRTITLTQDTVFTALFAKNTYTISAISPDSVKGIVTGSTSIEYLDSVTISASANYGYHFTQWSDGNTDNPRTLVVTQDSNLIVQFDYNQYSISLTIDTMIHGTVSGAGNYNYLSNRTIMAMANHGYHFTRWNDGVTDNPRTIILMQDTSFMAFFEKNNYTISVVSNDTVKGSVSGDTVTLYLDSITISATANYGYHFTHWNGGNTDNPLTVQVTDNTTYTAYFDFEQFTLTVQSNNTTQGNVSGGGNCNFLSSCTITATPNYGHHFTYWNDGVTENPRTIILTQDTTFTAHFAPNQYTLTVNAGEHGTATGSGTYNFGDTIMIQAFPEDHYHFTRWNDGNTENPRQYRIEDNITLTAFFVIDTYTVSVVSSDIICGMVEASGTEFVYGTPCTVTATAYTGYTFAGWSNGITANPYTFAVISDVELTAYFVPINSQGIDEMDTLNAKVYVSQGQIVVDGTEGNTVALYDVNGRLLARKEESGERSVFDVTASGTYMIKIGHYPARKVVVVR